MGVEKVKQVLQIERILRISRYVEASLTTQNCDKLDVTPNTKEHLRSKKIYSKYLFWNVTCIKFWVL